MKIPFSWEPIPKGARPWPGPIKTYRARVHGGWLLRVLLKRINSDTIFVCDPDHTWQPTEPFWRPVDHARTTQTFRAPVPSGWVVCVFEHVVTNRYALTVKCKAHIWSLDFVPDKDHAWEIEETTKQGDDHAA